MYAITNDIDFRVGYALQDAVQRAIAVEGSTRIRRKEMVAIKRELRRYSHRDTDFDCKIIKDEGMDGYVSLERLPDDIEDLDEAQRFFNEYIAIECCPSMYDCTGQAFTSWSKVFMRRGRYYAYHSVCFDV